MFKNKNILVTGGAGFIGSELCKQLSNKCNKLIIVDNLINGKIDNIKSIIDKNVIFKKIDIRDYENLSSILNDVDIIFHLACLGVRHSIHSPIENHEVNATATLNLLKLARSSKISKFIYVSTSEVYGNNVSVPISEKHSTLPATVYGSSKLAAEAYCRAYWDTYNFPVVIVRPFNSFGPKSHHEGDSGEVIPKFLLRSLLDEPLIIHGSGDQTRDFTYVGDTARGIILAGISDLAIGMTVNIGYGKEVSINDLAVYIKKIINKSKSEIIWSDPRPGDVNRLLSDSSLAKSLFGYEPKISLIEGIKLLLNWYGTDKIKLKNLLKDEIEKNWIEPK